MEVQAWLQNVREGKPTRQPLVIYGPHGSGKTTLARKLAHEFDTVLIPAVRPKDNLLEKLLSNYQVVILDNLKEPIPDLVFIAAEHMSLLKRKLYTDDELVTKHLTAATIITCVEKPVGVRPCVYLELTQVGLQV